MKPCKHSIHVENCRICQRYARRVAVTNIATTNTDTVSNTDTTRHLLYHIYPVKNSTWRWNVAELIKRINLFNGVRAVAVATDFNTDTLDEVRKAFGEHRVELFTIRNNPLLREVATFEPLFERVSNLISPEDVTLYAHAKGVTRAKASTAHRWSRALYEIHMDYWPRVKAILMNYPLAGAFKKTGIAWVKDSVSNWHYSGSWLWFRNRDLFIKEDWKRIDQFWSGIEPYPSLHFPNDQAGVIFMEGKYPTLELYSSQTWIRIVDPALARWRIKGAAAHDT